VDNRRAFFPRAIPIPIISSFARKAACHCYVSELFEDASISDISAKISRFFIVDMQSSYHVYHLIRIEEYCADH
jgi:hypothetical protein